jgi:hypothetical protein
MWLAGKDGQKSGGFGSIEMDGLWICILAYCAFHIPASVSMCECVVDNFNFVATASQPRLILSRIFVRYGMSLEKVNKFCFHE